MDNLTHSLAGAVLGQMGLKKKTGLAMPTLIIAANIPDIDAVATLLGGHTHLAIRRGITHGPIAMVILPLILWGIMLWYDGWQARRGTRPEKRLAVHKGWLLALAYLGCLSHPALDWMNVYGIRFLEPFSSKWVYGDTLFIIDIWIWIAAALGVWISLHRERSGQVNWQRPAWLSFTAICAYIFANGAITGHSETLLRERLTDKHQELGVKPHEQKLDVVASPIPVKFWEREMLWRDGPTYGFAWYSLASGMDGPDEAFFHGVDADRVKALSEMSEEAKHFLFWSRMPVFTQNGDELVISDQRFSDPLVGDRFNLRLQMDLDSLDKVAAPSSPEE